MIYVALIVVLMFVCQPAGLDDLNPGMLGDDQPSQGMPQGYHGGSHHGQGQSHDTLHKIFI